jgi:predicted ABC-type ATPase
MNRNLFIISGCNGAGKTTASYTVLPEILDCKEFVNADEIARGLSPFNLVRRAKEKGYIVRLLFFWLNSPELALLRIAERVAKGGHNIPELIVRRRYIAGINNLFRLFMNEVDYWVIYDNSEYPAVLIAKGGKNDSVNIMIESTYKTIADYVK